MEGHTAALSIASGTCDELEQLLQTVHSEAETATAAIAHPAPAADHTGSTELDGAAASTIADLKRQNAELREAKDREVASLSEEVKRLRAAIGQLVGIGAAT